MRIDVLEHQVITGKLQLFQACKTNSIAKNEINQINPHIYTAFGMIQQIDSANRSNGFKKKKKK